MILVFFIGLLILGGYGAYELIAGVLPSWWVWLERLGGLLAVVLVFHLLWTLIGRLRK